MRPVRLEDPADPQLRDYLGLTDVARRRLLEVEHGVFIAEGEPVLRRAAAAGYRLRSVLLGPGRYAQVVDLLDQTDAPVYEASLELLGQVTGFHVHRGVLACFERRPLPAVAEVLDGARRVLVCEDVVSSTNLGAVVRNAAGLGFDAVLLSPTCADPFYRRAVRVSMGQVFAVPLARFARWPDGVDVLRSSGFTTVALTPGAGSVDLAELAADPPAKIALLLGAEGPGLSGAALAAADHRVRIPMSAGVDSLNIGAAAAVACYALGPASDR